MRNCSDELKSPIYLLRRESLDSGKLPIDINKSVVISIHKKDSRASVEHGTFPLYRELLKLNPHQQMDRNRVPAGIQCRENTILHGKELDSISEKVMQTVDQKYTT